MGVVIGEFVHMKRWVRPGGRSHRNRIFCVSVWQRTVLPWPVKSGRSGV